MGRGYDRSNKRIEMYLDEMLAVLTTGGAVARVQRAKKAEEARLAKEAAEMCREQERQRRRLEKVTAFLSKKADKYAELVKLENLARHLKVDGQASNQERSELQRAFEFVLVNLRNEFLRQQ